MSGLRFLVVLLVTVALAAPMAGCGKKPRDLEAPEGGSPDFPSTYPTSK